MTKAYPAQDLNAVAQQLTQTLALQLPPIAITVTADPPEGIAAFDGVAAAGCQFWDIAAKGPVVTSTPDHELCAIGVHTLQMESPSDTCTQEIGDVLSVLSDLGYVRESDVARIPVMPRPSTHVIYAPLSNAPLPPDVVMLFADARHSLVITEAVEQIEEGLPPALGRPACAAIPQAINSGRAALSLGCCGARAYLDGLRDEVAIWAIPGDKIAIYADRITTLAHANKVLTQFHTRRREDIESGARPTVQESLARLN